MTVHFYRILFAEPSEATRLAVQLSARFILPDLINDKTVSETK
jgi:hypothetical protein